MFKFKGFNFSIVIIVFVVFALVFGGFVIAQQDGFWQKEKIFPKGAKYVPDQIIVKYRNGQSPDELKLAGNLEQRNNLVNSLAEIGVVAQEKLYTSKSQVIGNYYVLSLKKGVGIPETYDSLKRIPEVENAAPDYILRIQEAPDDPYFPQMWNLPKIKVQDTWGKVHVSGKVTIGVVDTGVDYNHPDLQGVVIKGGNFLGKGSNDPMDDQGHGTHVAGILGAVTNNGIGVSGVSWGAKILALKACDKDGNCNTSDVTRAMKYAVDNGAKIVNISIAGAGACNGTYNDMLSYAASHGVLVVSAAGNGNNGDGTGVNADSQIPAGCDKVLTVGAVTNENKRSSFSNFGSHVVVSAPGGSGPCSITTCVLSTGLANQYTLRAGTSMAAPQVSATAALLLANNPGLSSDKLRSCIIRSGDSLGDQQIGTLLNTKRALTLCSAAKTSKPTPTLAPETSPFSISGVAYIDQNGNQKFDQTEKLVSGVQVVLSGLSSDSVLTNSKGRYIFTELSPGIYTVSATVGGNDAGVSIDTVISKTASSAKVNVPIDKSLIQVPTSPVQKTSSGCFIDPTCLKGKSAFQVCSFQCN